jgi:hypothetical protein
VRRRACCQRSAAVAHSRHSGGAAAAGGRARIEVLRALPAVVLVELLAQRGEARHVDEADRPVEVVALRRVGWTRLRVDEVAEDDLGGRVAREEAELLLLLRPLLLGGLAHCARAPPRPRPAHARGSRPRLRGVSFWAHL